MTATEDGDVPSRDLNSFFTTWLTGSVCAGLLLSECGCGVTSGAVPSIIVTNSPLDVPSTFDRFVNEKLSLAETIGKKHGQHLSSTANDFFAAARNGDWATTSNLFFVLEAANHPSSGGWSPPVYWGAIHETYGVYELVHSWNAEFLKEVGDGVVKSIPPGSIYFGGTEAGRFAVSLFSQSHGQGRPFFTLTQNALSDPSYSCYVRDMYGGQINLPTDDDISRCVEEYKRDVQARLKHDQAFPSEPHQVRQGEEVRSVNGGVQIAGPVCVMAIHALVIKLILDRNPEREFYYEESYELGTIDPLLTPHQFVFKMSHQPVATISPEAVRADREFWSQKTRAWLGSWLKPDSTIPQITNFANRAYVHNELQGFQGNVRFIHDDEAKHAFSKLRCAIAGLYLWRSTQYPAERQRMINEADFAFRQAFAICPSNAETVMRYAGMLIGSSRKSDALSVVSMGCQLDPEHPAMRQLLESLRASDAAPK